MSYEPPDPASSGPPEARPGFGSAGLRAYLREYRGKFTDDTLSAELVKAGYAADDVRTAIASLAAEDRANRAADAAKPIRTRARRVIFVAYLATFVVLAAAMFASSSSSGPIGSGVLAISLGLALLISVGWVRWLGRRPGGLGVMAVLLAVPFVLLVVVAGLCVATGLPFRPTPA